MFVTHSWFISCLIILHIFFKPIKFGLPYKSGLQWHMPNLLWGVNKLSHAKHVSDFPPKSNYVLFYWIKTFSRLNEIFKSVLWRQLYCIIIPSRICIDSMCKRNSLRIFECGSLLHAFMPNSFIFVHRFWSSVINS